MMKKRLLYILLPLFLACNGDKADGVDHDLQNQVSVAAPQQLIFSVDNTYPHDTGAYTQGLQVYNKKLYEGTGDYSFSNLRITDIHTGKVEKKHPMGSNKIFGEGITILNNKIYQLTWQSHMVYVYDIKNIDLPIQTFNWPYEGWGITNNGTDLIISDGTANIYFVNPVDFKVKNTIQVKANTGYIDSINELEFIDGFIFANVYLQDFIVKIDPATGHVVGRIDLPGIIKQYAPNFTAREGEVLNGIAWDSATKKLYLTGKHWPLVFEGTLK